jgi:uncharacterized membrane protein
MRRLARLLVVAALVAVPALPATAKSFELPGAQVDLAVQPDGSVLVTEQITFDFDGSFSGAYREIPLRAGEQIVEVSVSEGRDGYAQGACADLGCAGSPGTFGTKDLGGRLRVVWHYAAFSEVRTFTVAYRMLGLAKAHDDVVDVEFQVWGSEWEVGLDRLTAGLTYPGEASPGDVRVWGKPAGVSGSTTLGVDGVSPALEASRIPAGRFVEMRVVFPRSLLASTGGATVVPGEGLDDILEAEQRAVQTSATRQAVLRVLVLVAGLMAFLPAVAGSALIYWHFGREPRVDYDREYEQEPPSDHPPAVIEGLLTQGAVDENGFTATSVRPHPARSDHRPAHLGRASDVGGPARETITDLELALGDTDGGLAAHERSVVTVMQRILDEGPQPLHEFRTKIRDDAAANAETYQKFRTQALDALERARLLDRSGLRWLVYGACCWRRCSSVASPWRCGWPVTPPTSWCSSRS